MFFLFPNLKENSKWNLSLEKKETHLWFIILTIKSFFNTIGLNKNICFFSRLLWKNKPWQMCNYYKVNTSSWKKYCIQSAKTKMNLTTCLYVFLQAEQVFKRESTPPSGPLRWCRCFYSFFSHKFKYMLYTINTTHIFTCLCYCNTKQHKTQHQNTPPHPPLTSHPQYTSITTK